MVLAFNNLARLYIQPLIQECQYFLEVLEIIFYKRNSYCGNDNNIKLTSLSIFRCISIIFGYTS